MQHIVKALKGFIIGAAVIVPGLSASIFAIVLGVYEGALNAVANFRKQPLVHFAYLLPLMIGGGIGVVVSARAAAYALAAFPAFAYLFFAGLVIGSCPLIMRKTRKAPFKPLYLTGSVIAFLAVILLVPDAQSDGHIAMYRLGGTGDFLKIMLVGLIAISMMAVPGVSGSIIIIMTGQLGTVYNSLGETFVFALHILGGRWSAAWDSLATVMIMAPFALGTVIGLVSIAKLMTFLIRRFEQIAYYAIGGALLGTVVMLANTGVVSNLPEANFRGIVIFSAAGAVCLTIGILATIFLDRPENSAAAPVESAD